MFVRDDDYRLFQVDGKGFSSSSSLNVFGRIKRNCRGDEIYICIKKEEDKEGGGVKSEWQFEKAWAEFNFH